MLIIVFNLVNRALYPFAHRMQKFPGPDKLRGKQAQCSRNHNYGRSGQNYHGNTHGKDRNAYDRHDHPPQFFERPIIHTDPMRISWFLLRIMTI